MGLLEEIQRFVDEFNHGENNFGTLQLRAHENDRQEELLPQGALQTFYARVAFDKLTIGTAFFLDVASLSELPRYQQGWRWEYDTEPVGVKDTETWKASWLVFGDRHGDALFAKVDSEAAPVFGSIQKAEEYQLASSLELFLASMTACLVMEREEFRYDTKLADFTIKPEFIDRTREIITQQESSSIAEQFVEFFFG